MERIWNRIGRTLRYGYLRIVRIKAPAESIALGMAMGVFAGALPFLSFQMIIAVSLAFLVRGNVIAAALGTWWTNPFNWPIVFPLLFLLGSQFVSANVSPLDIHELIHMPFTELLCQGWQWLLVTTLGGVIVGIPMAVGVYFMTLRMVRLYHDRRAERRRRKLQERP